MATRLQFQRPTEGMSFIWNVSRHVGDHASCPNQQTDVELVSILLAEIIRALRPAWVNQAVRTEFLVNGDMDVNTAYWIRIYNSAHRPRLSFEEEGKISPARGASWGGDTWTILKLNWHLKQANQNLWQNLPTHPNASPALQRELQQF